MAHKYMKKRSTSLIIRELQITMREHSMPSERQTITNAGKDIEKWKLILYKNINSFSH
jgi:hypothetical protein